MTGIDELSATQWVRPAASPEPLLYASPVNKGVVVHFRCSCHFPAHRPTSLVHENTDAIMQAIITSQTIISAPKAASRNLSARRTTKALAPRCVRVCVSVCPFIFPCSPHYPHPATRVVGYPRLLSVRRRATSSPTLEAPMRLITREIHDGRFDEDLRILNSF